MWVVEWKKLQMQACRLRSHTVDVAPPQAATKIMAGMAEQRWNGGIEWQTEWLNGGNGGNGRMAERMAEWQNGRNGYTSPDRLSGFHVCALVCSLSENKSFAFLTWATRRTKKPRRWILLCSSSVLDFSLSCVKRLVGNKFFDSEVECQTEWLHTYYLRYTPTTPTTPTTTATL